MANFKGVLNTAKSVVNKNMPHILTYATVTGIITVPILAVGATPKAMRLIKDEEEYLRRPLTKKEVIKLVWKCYIPTAGVALATATCSISANSINTKRNAALAGLYSLTENAFKEYQTKVVETIGDNKELKIRDEIDKDKIHNSPPTNVIITGKGDVLCYDPQVDRYFESDIEKIKQAVNEISYRLLNEMWISVNEFYYELGLPSVDLGYNQGFNIDDGKVEVTYSSQLTETGRPCLVLRYKVSPRKNY